MGHDEPVVINVYFKAVKKFVKRKCKCHGQTASCPTRTCWDELEDFRQTGYYLKNQFNKAAKGTVRQDGSIMRVGSNGSHKQLKRDQMVYLESSPNYCEKNLATGWLLRFAIICLQHHSHVIEAGNDNNLFICSFCYRHL